jgi:hypothetical protein
MLISRREVNMPGSEVCIVRLSVSVQPEVVRMILMREVNVHGHRIGLVFDLAVGQLANAKDAQQARALKAAG